MFRRIMIFYETDYEQNYLLYELEQLRNFTVFSCSRISSLIYAASSEMTRRWSCSFRRIFASLDSECLDQGSQCLQMFIQ